MAALIALYDANVLYSAELRNSLMHLALTGLFRAKRSAAIHEEWISNLLRNRQDLSRQRLERTRQLMDKAILDVLVEGYENLILSLSLPDENDRHVLAAAIRGGAQVLVTMNLKNFSHRLKHRAYRNQWALCGCCFSEQLRSNAECDSRINQATLGEEYDVIVFIYINLHGSKF
jgi:predicted nucleic acid-binding protein